MLPLRSRLITVEWRWIPMHARLIYISPLHQKSIISSGGSSKAWIFPWSRLGSTNEQFLIQILRLKRIPICWKCSLIHFVGKIIKVSTRGWVCSTLFISIARVCNPSKIYFHFPHTTPTRIDLTFLELHLSAVWASVTQLYPLQSGVQLFWSDWPTFNIFLQRICTQRVGSFIKLYSE